MENRERSAETRLWVAVLHNYFYDLFSLENYSFIDEKTRRSVHSELNKLERECNRKWFGQIAEFAGFEPDYVRRKAQRIINRMRENLKTGKSNEFQSLLEKSQTLRRGNRSRIKFGSRTGAHIRLYS